MIGVIVLVTSLLAGVTYAQFSPGCSFNDGHCMYNVQLGHYGQCDKRSVTSGDGACCDALQSQMTELVGDVNTLKSQVATLMSELTASKTNASATQNKLTEEEMRTEHLLQLLAQKEAELNTTQQELSQIISNAGNEIRVLRDQVGRLTNDLNSCKGMLGMATNTSTLPVSSILPSDVTLSFCDFEQHEGSSDGFMCGFTNTSGQYYHFTRSSGTHNSQTGPQEDHTYGAPSGHYMYIDSTHIGLHSTSGSLVKISMVSKEYPANQAGYCIRFWYNMHGSSVRDLNVYARIASGNGYPIFTRSGNSGEQWQLGEADLDSEYARSPFNLLIEATTTAHRYSTTYADIAVDDIYVYNTSCKNVPLCPSGSVTQDVAGTRFCYTFHTQPVTWYEAATACRQEGATSSLVTVTSQEEQDFIVQTIRNDSVLTAAGQYGFYTAGNDERSEHKFEWTDTGTPYIGTYTDWKAGQPNNVAGDQDCLLLQYPELNFQWGDVDCDERHPFVCKASYPISASGGSSSAGTHLIG